MFISRTSSLDQVCFLKVPSLAKRPLATQMHVYFYHLPLSHSGMFTPRQRVDMTGIKHY